MRARLVGLAVLVAAAVTGCAAGGTGTGSSVVTTDSPAATPSVSSPVTGSDAVGADGPGDPNAPGRQSAAATRTSASGGGIPPAPGAAGSICANETLGESMTRAVDSGASIVLARGEFTGAVVTADGEIGVPYSEVALMVDEQLAGPELPGTLSVYVYGDLGSDTGSAVTEEIQSLWAAGGRMIAIVEPSAPAGLPRPTVRVAPVVGDDVILSYVGCWTTNGVTVRPYDGAVNLFDHRGLHPTEIELFALPVADFRAVLPS